MISLDNMQSWKVEPRTVLVFLFERNGKEAIPEIAVKVLT